MALSRKSLNSLTKGFASNQKAISKKAEETRLAQENANMEETVKANAAADAESKKSGWDKFWGGVGTTATDIGKGLAGFGQRIAGTVSQGVDAAFAGANLIAGDKKKAAEWVKRAEDWSNADSIDGQKQSFISQDSIEGKSNPAQFAAEFTKAGADVATLVQPELNIGSTAAKIASEVGINAATTGAASAADQYAKTGGVDLGKTAKDAAVGGIIGGVVRGAREVVGAVKGGGKTTVATDTAKATDATPPEGQLALGSGVRKPVDVQTDLQRYQNGDFTPEDNVWKDNKVTTPDGQTVDINSVNKDIATNERKIADLQRQLDTSTGTVDANGNPVGDPLATTDVAGKARAVEEINTLQQKNAELQKTVDSAATVSGGSSSVIDSAKVADNFKNLQAELEHAKSIEYQQTGRTPAEIQADIDKMSRGEIPQDLTISHEPVTSAADIFHDTTLPEHVQNTAQTILDDKGKATQVLDGLMSKAKAEIAHAQMDQAYADQAKLIDAMPGPRQQIEQAKLDDKYTQDLQALDDKVTQDAPMAEQYQAIVDHLASKEAELVDSVNSGFIVAGDSFRVPDSKLVDQRMNDLQAELDNAKHFSDTNTILENNSADLPEKIKSDPQVADAYQAKLAMDTADLVPKSLSPIRRVFLAVSSYSRTFDAMGVRNVYRDIVKAEQKVIDQTKADFKILIEVGKSIKDNQVTPGEIVNALQDRTKIADLPDSVAGLRDLLDVKATQIQQKAYLDEVARLTDRNVKLKDDKKLSNADIEVKARAKAEKSTMDNYFSHMKLDPESARMLPAANDGKASSTINFGSLKQREGDGVQYSHDVIKVMSAYITGFNKKFYLEPALKVLDNPKFIEKLDATEKGVVEDYIGQVRNMKTSALEASVNNFFQSVTKGKSGGNEYRRFFGAQRVLSAVAGMGGSFSTIARQLTQSTNTVVEVGALNTARGAVHFMQAIAEHVRTGNFSPEMELLMKSGELDQSAMASIGDELTRITGGRSGVGSAMRKPVDVLLAGVKYSDQFNRGQAFYAGLLDGAQKGLKGDELTNHALDVTHNTQFNTSRMDMPKALNGPMVRSLAQFATFGAKQVEFLIQAGFKPIKDAKSGNYRLAAQDMGRLLQAATVGFGMTAVLSPMIGFQPSEWLPFSQNIAEGNGYVSPMLRLLIGDKGKVGLNSLIWREKITDEVTGKSRDLTPAEAAQRFWDDNWSGIVPAGAQIKKTTGGMDMLDKGLSTNDSGKVQFMADKSPGTDLQALLFGKYANKGGQDWVAQGMPTLSQKQSDEILSMPKENRQKYYDFYLNAKKGTEGRDKAVETVKEQALSSPAMAMRTASEFNAQVDKQMEEYYKRNSTMPVSLREKITNELKIDAVDQIQNADNTPSLTTLQKKNQSLRDMLGL